MLKQLVKIKSLKKDLKTKIANLNLKRKGNRIK
jgi:hypothetical protein